MDRPTLQTPKTGRSRFSKALPAPPPQLEDDKPSTVSRDPPSSMYSPFPPRKDSVSVRTNTSISQISPSIKSDLNSPLPSLPPSLPPTNTMASTVLQTQTRSIPRKPVGLPANPAPVAGASAAKSKKMKRVSSISSLLSAYSNTSSDSVQRSSQGSIFTKDSEPSNSPEREGMNDTQPSLSKTLPVLPSNPYADDLPSVTGEIISADLPPPPPLKDPTRPSTPSSARPVDSFPAPPRSGAQDGSPPSTTPKPVGDSPPRREIWRRRASVKSDRSLLVPELKLADSHGSTASTSTSQPPAANTANSDLLPPPPLTQTTSSNTTSPLPPRSASLPGRNIRPTKTEPQQEDEMRKLSSKFKGLTTRGESAKEPAKTRDSSNGTKDESIKSASNAQPEAQPAGPIKDHRKVEPPINVSMSSAETVAHAPSPAAASSEPPPKESAPKSISRRAVGSPIESQKPEFHKKGSSSDLRMQNLGLPRHPRSARSNSSLRSPQPTHDVQEAVRPRVVPQPQPIPTIEMTTTMPADSIEPMRKPELFNIVTALNEPNISPNLMTTDRKPYRKVSPDVHATNLSDIGESMENVTPEHAEKVNEALSRFPRNVGQAIPPTDAVWQAPPITSQHHNCYVRHSKWVPVKNSNYPLACQTCGVQDTNSRKTCSWCNLRVCYGCHERLMGRYKADLRMLMQNMETDQIEEKRREKGKQSAA
ncbi:uncharacterized protein GGS22DRAFT_167515 [Annulohypoxylon maeteangense]|uniref:uncharacterized protein n=1 Tax=Annulohypoxylon maeteangense TaxID=1927788 RepID=UPI0020077959|nr:uncharacterized protein GGS22DRAFT_167515 [Annulohypoxylon maeteangense]KAI0883602.1 hypothetical protein GGS22DRAFT_167515 [Annulohypoxylon maeteangense]